MKQPFEVEIIVSDGTNSRTAAVIQAGQKEYEPMEVQLDLTGLQGEIKLELVSTAETKTGCRDQSGMVRQNGGRVKTGGEKWTR